MSLNFLQSFYSHVRNTLLWFVIYFIIQTLIWVMLGILVLIYPQALFVLAVVFFFILAVVSLYFAILVARYVYKLKKLKNLISFEE